jgi:hypothetical protein
VSGSPTPDDKFAAMPQNSEESLIVQLLDIQWQPRPGVSLIQLKTYGCGIGSEYVYCYSFPTYVEMAELKQEQRFRVKVGMATDDPIGRIYGQIAGSRTAVSETPVVLLIFKTLAARHLERWFHTRLERASDAAGSEWFHTSVEELIDLFRKYVCTATVQAYEATEPTSSNAPRNIVAESSSTIPRYEETAIATDSDLPRRATGQHRRDADGKTAKDHVLLLWVKTTLNNDEPSVEAWSQQFGVETRTIRSWMSCWRNYKGSTFTGTEGWPRITHSILNDVLAAIGKANST